MYCQFSMVLMSKEPALNGLLCHFQRLKTILLLGFLTYLVALLTNLKTSLDVSNTV